MIKKLLSTLAICTCASAAQANVFTYEYVGPEVFCEVGSFDCIPGEPNTGFTASLTIDADLLGTSISNANIFFEVGIGPMSPSLAGPTDAITSFTWNYGFGSGDFFGTIAGASFNLSTDAMGNITSGVVGFADGPPDGSFGGTIDSYLAGDAFYSSREAGSWTTTSAPAPIIPLPAGAPLLLGALGALALARRARRD